MLAGFGYWQLIQKSTGLFWLTYAIPVLHVAVISGRVWDWPAGPAWGPRLLSPMLPLLELNLPALWKGDVSPNLGMLPGLPAQASVALFYAVLIAGGAWLWRGSRPGRGEMV